MNIKVIILGIVMVVVLYFLYKYLLGNKPATITNLRHDKPLDPFTYSSLTIPNSTRYSYYIWICINTIDTTNANIFKVTDKGKSKPLFSLDIKNTTDLQVSVLTQTDIINTNKISHNFPIQTWQQVIVSFDNTYMDVYINGKFIKSTIFVNTALPVQTTSDSVINFGVKEEPSPVPTPPQVSIPPPDISIRQFERLEYPMDPQTAWNRYKSDSNSNNSATAVTYGLNLNIGTNNKIGQSIPIF